jgi:DNA-binding transcriptional regulator YhcF (GntR family)
MRGWEFTVTLDPGREEPLFLQLANNIAEDIQRRRLKPGEPLPGSRELAGRLGLNRNTVVAGYNELAAQGLVCTRRGRGTLIAAQAAMPLIQNAAAGIRLRVRTGDPMLGAETEINDKIDSAHEVAQVDGGLKLAHAAIDHGRLEPAALDESPQGACEVLGRRSLDDDGGHSAVLTDCELRTDAARLGGENPHRLAARLEDQLRFHCLRRAADQVSFAAAGGDVHETFSKTCEKR